MPADTCLPAAKPPAEQRKLVGLVGTLKVLAIAVRNMDDRRRVTLLRQRLQALDEIPRLPVNWSPPGVLPRIAPA